MGVPTRATRHAGGLYRKTFDTVLRPVRKIESEAHHLHEVEQVGRVRRNTFRRDLGRVPLSRPDLRRDAWPRVRCLLPGGLTMRELSSRRNPTIDVTGLIGPQRLGLLARAA